MTSSGPTRRQAVLRRAGTCRACALPTSTTWVSSSFLPTTKAACSTSRRPSSQSSWGQTWTLSPSTLCSSGDMSFRPTPLCSAPRGLRTSTKLLRQPSSTTPLEGTGSWKRPRSAAWQQQWRLWARTGGTTGGRGFPAAMTCRMAPSSATSSGWISASMLGVSMTFPRLATTPASATAPGGTPPSPSRRTTRWSSGATCRAMPSSRAWISQQVWRNALPRNA
mmetsp:Transcript_8862/g.25268  ORF Transcript_8862/g.25268 Transcript_8862/m.25268 type:complete len:222 (-) Transcript_8862:552-1217(-)